MTDCNGCGSCCDPVTLPFPPDQLAVMAARMPAADATWVWTALTPMTAADAHRLEPWLRSRRLAGTLDGRTYGDQPVYFYRCAWFDRTTRQCTHYDTRPTTCRVYPWPNGTPVPGTALPPSCSYRADIGQPVTLRARTGGADSGP